MKIKNKYNGEYLDCGWISPTGQILQCQYYQHMHIADEYTRKNDILISGERFLESHGWLKLSHTLDSNIYIALYNADITTAQIKSIRKFLITFDHYNHVRYNGQYYTLDNLDSMKENN